MVWESAEIALGNMMCCPPELALRSRTVVVMASAPIVRRQNIRRNSQRSAAECGSCSGADTIRRACGAASGDARCFGRLILALALSAGGSGVNVHNGQKRGGRVGLSWRAEDQLALRRRRDDRHGLRLF